MDFGDDGAVIETVLNRKPDGQSIDDFAAQFGFSGNYFSRLGKDRRPSRDWFRAVFRVYPDLKPLLDQAIYGDLTDEREQPDN